MRITLHIGYNKAGSSSIQQYCFKNAAALRQAGLYYPILNTNKKEAHRVVSNYFIGRPANKGVNAPPDWLAEVRDDVVMSGCDHLLLSSEYLLLASAEQTQAIRDALEREFNVDRFSIIVYLRRHDLWFESLFNFMVRAKDSPPWALNINDFILHLLGSPGERPHFEAVLDQWAGVFGDPAVTVRPFEAEQFQGGNLLSDFFAHVCPEYQVASDMAGSKTNAAVSSERTYVIGLLRRWPPSPERDRAISILMKAAEPEKRVAPEHFDRLTNDQRQALIRYFTPEYRQIAQRFLNRKDGRLFIGEGSKTTESTS